MTEQQTEVLVAGAGPVGLLTAVLLAEAGIQAQIIDREERITARSYACALHPRSLRLLARLGVAGPIIEKGLRVPKMAFYDGPERRAEIDFAALGGEFPYLLVVPQSALEGILEEKLRQKARTAVHWNHRFDGVESEEDGVLATVERLGGTALGYIVPHWETVVQKRFGIRAQFLVGADGHNSLVRRRLAIENEHLARTQAFVACEFTTDGEPLEEVRVVLDETTTNVLWPLPDQGYRWGFELIHSNAPSEFPEKDRRAMPTTESNLNEQIRGSIQRLTRHRAPWFADNVKEITWCKQVAFEHRLAKEFGQNRCWLVGDAAHQTSPVGMQSMNVGFLEAEELVGLLQKIIHEAAPLELLQEFNRGRQEEWRQLLGAGGGLLSRADTGGWLRSRSGRMLACLPGSGEELASLASQLKLDLPGAFLRGAGDKEPAAMETHGKT